ncbi:MAG: exodeoxyribonuclease VII large subunit [Candidatus Cryptobacteroides sp.]
MMKDCLDLLELQILVREGLENLFPEKLWVKAETASVNAKLGGHCYLELVQTRDGAVVSKVRATIWAARWKVIKPYFESVTGSSLAPGMEILIQVQVSYSEVYGFSLSVTDINPEFSLGKKEAMRRETIRRLQQEGLWDLQKSLSLSALPYRFAVISSADAAGYGDFTRHLIDNQYGFVFDLQLFPSSMQGADCPGSIASAIDLVSARVADFDAVLILRGGGSALDLDCYDDYAMASAIARCPIPVLTAVGHDRDCHICDMVSYAYLKTPTALADEIIGIFEAEDARLSEFASRMKLAFANRISQMELKLQNLLTRIVSADPRNILKRGYVLVADGRGVVARSASAFSEGDRVKLMFADGQVEADIVRISGCRDNGLSD